jgi:hypothetical protein
LADNLGLAAAFSNPNLLPINTGCRDAILSEYSTYIDIYLAAMNLSHHNIILSDYSYFQIGMELEGYVRYAYYPNPFISGKDTETTSFKKLTDLLEAELISHEQFLSLLDSKRA